jgi:4-hydroxy-tetrahydrodipicolinate reductase
MRVVVLGAAGRMGSTVCAAVAGDDGLELAAAVDPAFAAPSGGRNMTGTPGAGAARSAASLEELDGERLDVAVDFTTAAAVVANADWCARHGVHFVCGTTGLGERGLVELERRFGGGDPPNCVLAPNFAVSAVLMMRLAELAAPYFDGVEIIELHHAAKRDAPSGTALETARRIAAARSSSGRGPFVTDPTEVQLPGSRGARVPAGGGAGSGGAGNGGAVSGGAVSGGAGSGGAVGGGTVTGGPLSGGAGSGEKGGGPPRGAESIGVPVHAVRLPGLVAHQEVLFGTTGQSLTIRQDSYDRSSFMPGVLLAVHSVATHPG